MKKGVKLVLLAYIASYAVANLNGVTLESSPSHLSMSRVNKVLWCQHAVGKGPSSYSNTKTQFFHKLSMNCFSSTISYYGMPIYHTRTQHFHFIHVCVCAFVYFLSLRRSRVQTWSGSWEGDIGAGYWRQTLSRPTPVSTGSIPPSPVPSLTVYIATRQCHTQYLAQPSSLCFCNVYL